MDEGNSSVKYSLVSGLWSQFLVLRSEFVVVHFYFGKNGTPTHDWEILTQHQFL